MKQKSTMGRKWRSGVKCVRKVWMSIKLNSGLLSSRLMLLMPQFQLEDGFMTAHQDDWQLPGPEFDRLMSGLNTHHWLKVKSPIRRLSFWEGTCSVHRQRQDKKSHNGGIFWNIRCFKGACLIVCTGDAAGFNLWKNQTKRSLSTRTKWLVQWKVSALLCYCE